jgi:hypothetical protein
VISCRPKMTIRLVRSSYDAEAGRTIDVVVGEYSSRGTALCGLMRRAWELAGKDQLAHVGYDADGHDGHLGSMSSTDATVWSLDEEVAYAE